MASIYYNRKTNRWRVSWHCKLPDGTIDKGSRSFGGDKKEAHRFKKHCEDNIARIKEQTHADPIFIGDAVSEWTDSCQRLAETTRKLYISEMEKFIEYLDNKVIYVTDIQKSHINQYVNFRLTDGLGECATNNILFAIKNFCKYMDQNYKVENPSAGIHKFKENPPDHNFINEKQYQDILTKVVGAVRSWVVFLSNTGLRVSEFCRLDWKSCDLKEKTITVVGKGKKRRTIGLNKTALGILTDQNLKTGGKRSNVVFQKENGEQLTRHDIYRPINKVFKSFGWDGGPHALRHFFATTLLLRGVPIIKVSLLLGHSSVVITQTTYAHILPKDLLNVTSVLDEI